MGAWGEHPMQNDSALDYLVFLMEELIDHVERLLIANPLKEKGFNRLEPDELLPLAPIQALIWLSGATQAPPLPETLGHLMINRWQETYESQWANYTSWA